MLARRLLAGLLALRLVTRSLGGYALKPRPLGGSNTAPNFRVRVAKQADIPAIRNCNLETLPENYSDEFYRRHLSLWPRLAIVAEQEGKLIGYTLGRVDTQPSQRIASFSTTSEIGTYAPPQTVGHVASIAVYQPYRKMGVAKALMDMLHLQMMTDEVPVDTVSLHCRVSNAQAIRLYSGYYSYTCISVVPKYYEDAEDAWLMRLNGLQAFMSNRLATRSLSLAINGDEAGKMECNA